MDLVVTRTSTGSNLRTKRGNLAVRYTITPAMTQRTFEALSFDALGRTLETNVFSSSKRRLSHPRLAKIVMDQAGEQ